MTTAKRLRRRPGECGCVYCKEGDVGPKAREYWKGKSRSKKNLRK